MSRTYDLEFVAVFRKRIEANSEEEALDILANTSISDVVEDYECDTDPWEFQKRIRDSWDNEDEEG